ncbi:MAG TPA: hypothetical protein VL403_15770, partial [Candidatus Kryptonia bacterium]|nr:hypothetical protein [Candidatus Kryptonia bacterium]
SGCVVIERVDDAIETRMEVGVAPNDDVEIRRVILRNRSRAPRRIELTSCAEVVLNFRAAHAAHPAFSKLFVSTEYVAAPGALLARRRPRSRSEQHPWMVHRLIGDGALQYETDRARFVGRGRSLRQPLAVTRSAPLSGTTGNVLDPIFSLRRVVHLPPGESVEIGLLLGAASTRAAAITLAADYSDAAGLKQVFEKIGRQEHVLLQRLGISRPRAEQLQQLAGAMLYNDQTLRADAAIVRRAAGDSATLARYGVTGNGPLAVAFVDDVAPARDLFTAHAYWQAKGLRAELIVIAKSDSVAGEIGRTTGANDAVRIYTHAELPAGDLDLIQTYAHLVTTNGLAAPRRAIVADGESIRYARVAEGAPAPQPTAKETLHYDNGYGGFAANGCEYVIRLDSTRSTHRPPMPWVNVIANDWFGFLVSESGAGYTWSQNSRENRLTPWYNDPIADPYGEALYLRDEDTRIFWSPQPGPIGGRGAYEVRHGFGYTQWRHSSEELTQETVQFVARSDRVKVTRIRLRNTGQRARRLSIFAYYRLVLGVFPIESGRFVVTDRDADGSTLFARNRLNNEFRDGVVFAAIVMPPAGGAVHCTGDRAAFIGRNGSPAAPRALREAEALDGTTGATLDPCAALQLTVQLAPGSAVECAFLLGEAADRDGARAVCERYRQPRAIARALQDVRAFWADTLSAVQVHTPSPALDLMLNGWLLYQTLSCRLWGRSALYQSGGAFGFRDQLQDAAALVYARPDVTRAQILLHAGHQFVAGDVLHWWHPPINRGIRTRFSDDLLWLPYVATFYAQTTGDWKIFDERAVFVTARSLAPGEDEAYLFASESGDTADLYTHCCRALDRSLTGGAHGLPLMGTGDWNDGMNRVGREGRGESVWVGFFLYKILDDFIPVCERRADLPRAQRYRAHQTRLRAALNHAGWDGAWFRRAYYDDGTPLGSAQNDECRIDALAQAWAVLSNATAPERAAAAMAAVEQQLMSVDAGLIRLLTPPFDRDPHDPGYIKGYLPGIRENGGQYTHAAVWVVQAMAAMGWRDRAAAWLERLGPIHHASTSAQVAVYQVEPYVVAADIYGVAPHVGRGGWTWYTGSAGWMYRVGIEAVLGLRLEGGTSLYIQPCVPDDWPEFRATFRLPDGTTCYDIVVRNPTGNTSTVREVTIDGGRGRVMAGAARVPLVRDGSAHHVEVTLGQPASATPRSSNK